MQSRPPGTSNRFNIPLPNLLVDTNRARVREATLARFALAQALFAGGDKEGGVDHLLDIIRMNRAWNEEAARKELVKFFEAMGPTDPLTLSARRRASRTDIA